jgi:hypothetical protein
MRSVIAVGFAVIVGVIVLLGYFLPIKLLLDLRQLMVEWAGILAAVALLVGVSNLFHVHLSKINASHGDSFYSYVLIISLTLTLILVGWFGPVHSVSKWIFYYIQIPIESSFMALLALILVYIIIRMFKRRLDHIALIFSFIVVFMLITSSLLLRELTIFNDLRAWITQVPAVAGARGILIGVVLGVVAAGLRILMASDRPYGG